MPNEGGNYNHCRDSIARPHETATMVVHSRLGTSPGTHSVLTFGTSGVHYCAFLYPSWERVRHLHYYISPRQAVNLLIPLIFPHLTSSRKTGCGSRHKL